MNHQEKSGNITRQALYMSLVLTFVLGFLCGVVFTSYKNSALNAPAEPSAEKGHSESDIEGMALALKKEIEKKPDNAGAWIQLGNLYFDHGENEKAVRAYEKAIELDPENADVFTDLGVVYRRTGNPQKAVESFDKAVAVNKSHKTARFNKGIVLMHDLNNKAEAIRVWKELAETDPLFTTPNGQSLDELILHYNEHE